MMEELNFNKEDIDRENQAFYEWNEQVKGGKTWHAYFLKGGNNTYVGLISGKSKYQFVFRNRGFDEVRRRMKIQNLRTNLDDEQTMFDKNILQDCRKLAENEWHKDCGLGYQVKEQGR